jgi:hypothetical protein
MSDSSFDPLDKLDNVEDSGLPLHFLTEDLRDQHRPDQKFMWQGLVGKFRQKSKTKKFKETYGHAPLIRAIYNIEVGKLSYLTK